MYKSAEHKAFLKGKYDQDKFIEKMWLKKGQEGRDLYTYAKKCADQQLKKQAADYDTKDVIEELTQELFTDLWLTLRNKSGLETMLDAYAYSTKVIQERVKDLPLQQWFIPVQLENTVEQAAYIGKKTERFRDKEGRPRKRTVKGESGELIDATEYKLDPYHQAYLAGNTRRKAQARNNTDLIEFEDLDQELHFTADDEQKHGNTDGIAAPVNPMIGHNGPPEEEQSYTPDDSVREDEEDDNRFFKEADLVMGRLGLWDAWNFREREMMRLVYLHVHRREAHNKGENWAWYEAGKEIGMSNEAARKAKEKMKRKAKPSQEKRHNIKPDKLSPAELQVMRKFANAV